MIDHHQHAIEIRAREIWHANQADLPKFTRRMPDAMDMATGAWARCIDQATEEYNASLPFVTIGDAVQGALGRAERLMNGR